MPRYKEQINQRLREQRQKKEDGISRVLGSGTRDVCYFYSDRLSNFFVLQLNFTIALALRPNGHTPHRSKTSFRLTSIAPSP